VSHNLHINEFAGKNVSKWGCEVASVFNRPRIKALKGDFDNYE
jgi:hypothetical protein